MENSVVEEVFYNSVIDLLNDFNSNKNEMFVNGLDFGSVYRGESSEEYFLLPTALRANSKENLFATASYGTVGGVDDSEHSQFIAEYLLLKQFFHIADKRGLPIPNADSLRHGLLEPLFDIHNISQSSVVWLPTELRELAGLAQHYGIQTRLLDWSYDIFVALYFAASGAIRKYHSGNVDTNDNLILWILNTTRIKSEIMANSWHVETHSSSWPLTIVRPPYNGNPNLAAQSGLFSLWEIETLDIRSAAGMSDASSGKRVDRTPLDRLLENTPKAFSEVPFLYKCIIPISECFKIMQLLVRYNYDSSRIFPGYDGIANAIIEKELLARTSRQISSS